MKLGIEIRDSRVLLTGASSGIGRELALELAAKGARVAVAARRRERLETLASEIGGAAGGAGGAAAARRRERLETLASEIEGRGGTLPTVLETDLSRRGAAAA